MVLGLMASLVNKLRVAMDQMAALGSLVNQKSKF